MRQAILIAGLAAFAVASPAPQNVNFVAVNAAPEPTRTGPPINAASDDVPYDTTLVSAQGAAAATGVASASATAAEPDTKKRLVRKDSDWGHPDNHNHNRNGWGKDDDDKDKWGKDHDKDKTKSKQWGGVPSKSSSVPPWTSSSWNNPTTTTSMPQKHTTTPQSSSQTPTTTTSQGTTGISTTSSDTSCPTTPEAGTYCGFINPEDPCAPQPDGYGPHVEPDTPEAFLAYPEFHKEAQAAKSPAGYERTFVDLNASSYDVSECGDYCNNKTLCTGFNIFFERDPSLNPSDNCTDPASITNYKCTLWGSGVYDTAAINTGGTRGAFVVVIAGSNGYEKTNTTTPSTPPGWQPPKQCGGDGSKVHNHPHTVIGTSFFPGPYNPALCAAHADAQNSRNKKSSGYRNSTYNSYDCKFFNSYMLTKNGHPLGTYCHLYSQKYLPNHARYEPGWQDGSFWGIESSWSYEVFSSNKEKKSRFWFW